MGNEQKRWYLGKENLISTEIYVNDSYIQMTEQNIYQSISENVWCKNVFNNHNFSIFRIGCQVFEVYFLYELFESRC